MKTPDPQNGGGIPAPVDARLRVTKGREKGTLAVVRWPARADLSIEVMEQIKAVCEQRGYGAVIPWGLLLAEDPKDRGHLLGQPVREADPRAFAIRIDGHRGHINLLGAYKALNLPMIKDYNVEVPMAVQAHPEYGPVLVFNLAGQREVPIRRRGPIRVTAAQAGVTRAETHLLQAQTRERIRVLKEAAAAAMHPQPQKDPAGDKTGPS